MAYGVLLNGQVTLAVKCDDAQFVIIVCLLVLSTNK